MAYRNKSQEQKFSDSYIRVDDDGTMVHTQHEYIGFGRVHYNFIGTLEGITAAVARVKINYPPEGYGTSFNWPPGRTWLAGARAGELIEHNQPEEISPGLWHLRGSHSNSCD